MPTKLYESDFLTVDLRSLINDVNNASAYNDNSANKENTPSADGTNTALPAKGTWGEPWEKILKKRIEDNNALGADKNPDYDVEAEFFEDFFSTNWEADLMPFLMALGEPLRKAIKVLKFEPTHNPILGFLTKEFAKELLRSRKLNVLTFKAIFNAVANKLVADTEFINQANNYNIIYCKDLYNKSAKEMEEYLKLQSEILKVSESSYTAKKQEENKKVFFVVATDKVQNDDGKEELEPHKRAALIRGLTSSGIEDITNATLNDLELAKLIRSNTSDTVHMSKEKQDVITNSLTKVSQIFAALVALSVNSKNEKATAALSNDKFKNVDPGSIVSATAELATNKIIPAGRLQKDEVDTLVDKLLARLQEL